MVRRVKSDRLNENRSSRLIEEKVRHARAGIQYGGGGAKTQNLDSRFSLRLIRPKPCGGFAGKTDGEVDFQSTLLIQFNEGATVLDRGLRVQGLGSICDRISLRWGEVFPGQLELNSASTM